MKNLLIEGVSGTGKTTLILETLGNLMDKAGGFVTVRLLDGDGRRTGFAVKKAERGAKPDKVFENSDIPDRFICFEGESRAEVPKFVELASRYIERAGTFLVMDEFGGIELENGGFADRIAEILENGRPVIGVIKMRENAEHAIKHMTEGSALMEEYESFRRRLEGLKNTQIIRLSDDNREEAKSAIIKWMADNGLMT